MRARQLAILSVSVVALMTVMATAQAETIGVTFTTTLFQVDNYQGDVTGYRFKVGPNPIVVTQLGFFDEDGDGLLTEHQVGIFQRFAGHSNPAGHLMVQTTVPEGTAATLDDKWRFVSITPTTLEADTTYNALAYRPVVQGDTEEELVDPAFSDGVAYNALGVTAASFLTGTSDVHEVASEPGGPDTGGLIFVDTPTFYMAVGNQAGWYGPAFKAAEVPEPSSVALLGMGLLGICGWLWRRRG